MSLFLCGKFSDLHLLPYPGRWPETPLNSVLFITFMQSKKKRYKREVYDQISLAQTYADLCCIHPYQEKDDFHQPPSRPTPQNRSSGWFVLNMPLSIVRAFKTSPASLKPNVFCCCRLLGIQLHCGRQVRGTFFFPCCEASWLGLRGPEV